MNRQSYLRIMMAIANLVLVIMVEAGKVPYKSAKKVADALFQAATGKKIEDAEQ